MVYAGLIYGATTNQDVIDFIITEPQQTKTVMDKYIETLFPKSFQTIQRYNPETKTMLVLLNTFV